MLPAHPTISEPGLRNTAAACPGVWLPVFRPALCWFSPLLLLRNFWITLERSRVKTQTFGPCDKAFRARDPCRVRF